MKILITGNMGYVGPGVVTQLRATYPGAELIGFDMGYFGSCLINAEVLPEAMLDKQIFGDVRHITRDVVEGVAVVVHLAAISNDPMGNRYEAVTRDVNYLSSIRLAQLAKNAGVRSFVFASSCSMYGESDGYPKTEDSALNPLTAYAKSKVFTEDGLDLLADETFTVTCLRFATACGMSKRLRLDLVLNDFVACAVTAGEITILSDGTPWRPLIHVKDMARAIDWAVQRTAVSGGQFLAINAGSNSWNYQVKDLAEAVVKLMPGTEISLNLDAVPDKRSYRVDFGRFEALAPHHQPQYTLSQTIKELLDALLAFGLKDKDFRNSFLVRLHVLNGLLDREQLTTELAWTDKQTT